MFQKLLVALPLRERASMLCIRAVYEGEELEPWDSCADRLLSSSGERALELPAVGLSRSRFPALKEDLQDLAVKLMFVDATEPRPADETMLVARGKLPAMEWLMDGASLMLARRRKSDGRDEGRELPPGSIRSEERPGFDGLLSEGRPDFDGLLKPPCPPSIWMTLSLRGLLGRWPGRAKRLSELPW
mmetsp:Transcript_47756/g.136407  ORF Transcript_47756/g.136407 Transcript_47756/m.136407 type:complete len:187 (-) Transcript_47756:263-823(-)